LCDASDEDHPVEHPIASNKHRWDPDHQPFELAMTPMLNKLLSLVEKDKLVKNLRDLEEQWRAFEGRLRQDELENWEPHWTCSAPLTERMLRVGYSQEAVAALAKHLTTIYRFLCGESLSLDIKGDRNEIDAAQCASDEIAMKQLAAIVIAAANVPKPLKWPRHNYYGIEALGISEPLRSLRYTRFVG
jgi:hypothetical protein